MNINGPITIHALDELRRHMLSLGASKGVLCIRTWPALQEQFEAMPGFRDVEEYEVEELDNMQHGEIGRVCGFHIVVRWNGTPVRSASGQYHSEVLGGAQPHFIDSEAQE